MYNLDRLKKMQSSQQAPTGSDVDYADVQYKYLPQNIKDKYKVPPMLEGQVANKTLRELAGKYQEQESQSMGSQIMSGLKNVGEGLYGAAESLVTTPYYAATGQFDKASEAAKKGIPSLGKAITGGVQAGMAPISTTVGQVPGIKQGFEGVAYVADTPFRMMKDKMAKAKGMTLEQFEQSDEGQAISTAGLLTSFFTIPKIAKVAGKIGGSVLGGLGTGAKNISARLMNVESKTLSEATALQGKVSEGMKAGLTSEPIATKILDAVNRTLEQKGELGTGYEAIRQVENVIPTKNVFKSQLKEWGILERDGKLTATGKSAIRDARDLSELQVLYERYGNRDLSTTEVLNFRQDVSNLSGYDKATTTTLQKQMQGLRGKIDTIAKDTVPGLTELDKQYSNITQQFGDIVKDWAEQKIVDGKRQYVLKDNAWSKINNLLKESNKERLGRLEELVPGITEDIRILNVINDVARSEGARAGFYERAMKSGAGFTAGYSAGGGVMGGIMGALGTELLSNPKLIIPLLENYGKFRAGMANIVGKLKSGQSLTPDESIEVKDNIKNLPPEAIQRAVEGNNPKFVKMIEERNMRLELMKKMELPEQFSNILVDTNSLKVPLKQLQGSGIYRKLPDGFMRDFNTVTKKLFEDLPKQATVQDLHAALAEQLKITPIDYVSENIPKIKEMVSKVLFNKLMESTQGGIKQIYTQSLKALEGSSQKMLPEPSAIQLPGQGGRLGPITDFEVPRGTKVPQVIELPGQTFPKAEIPQTTKELTTPTKSANMESTNKPMTDWHKEAMKFDNMEEFLKAPLTNEKMKILRSPFADKYEYHLSVEPDLIPGKSFSEQTRTVSEAGSRGESAGEGIYTTKQPHMWESQIAYENVGEMPTELYLVKVKNPAPVLSEGLHQTVSNPSDVIVIKKILSNKSDNPLDIGKAEAIRNKTILEQIWKEAHK